MRTYNTCEQSHLHASFICSINIYVKKYHFCFDFELTSAQPFCFALYEWRERKGVVSDELDTFVTPTSLMQQDSQQQILPPAQTNVSDLVGDTTASPSSPYCRAPTENELLAVSFPACCATNPSRDVSEGGSVQSVLGVEGQGGKA